MFLPFLAPAPVVISDVLTIGSVSRGGRIPFPTDAVVDQMINGTWKEPKADEPFGKTVWKAKQVGKDGWFDGLQGYAFAKVSWPQEGVAILKAAGHGMVYVNGEPHMGDPYSNGYSQLPILVHAGANSFLFANGRGRLHAELEAPRADLFWNMGDLTTPDLIADGESHEYWLGAILVNAKNETSGGRGYEIWVDGRRAASGRTPRLQPVEARKIGLRFQAMAGEGDTAKVTLKLVGGDTQNFTLRVRKPNQTRRVTFMSRLDNSVQYYGLVPPTNPRARALVLTVHGASVEGIGQAEAYSAKDWCWIVAPTNRRPYGFDWEDMGRMDALEVLDLAMKEHKVDAHKVYLTGHSMGGHGTWSMGAIFPQKFAAIAPSAGWRSFFTYGGKPAESGSAMIDLVNTASNPSATQLMYDNYRNQEVYILHGDADDNVPVSEARAMKTVFAEMGKSIGYWEQPGAGHWWDGDKSPGADCVDWPPLFEMFQRTSQKRTNPLNFVTVNPAISTGFPECEILLQEKRMRPSSIRLINGFAGWSITTENARGLKVRAAAVTIDGQKMSPEVTKSGSFYVEKIGGQWTVKPSVPTETGPFKESFQNHMVLVFGTHGMPEENAWMRAKARFDAEQLWYRGNSGVEVVSDAQFRDGSRNVVVYGNGSANSVWGKLLRSPITLKPGHGALVSRSVGRRMVAGIGGGDLVGMRSTERLPYFVSGVAYPDWVVVSSAVAAKGYDGVVAAGYWGADGGLGETVGTP